MAEPTDGGSKLSQEDFARLGGQARAKKLGADERRKIALKASKAAAKKRRAEKKNKSK